MAKLYEGPCFKPTKGSLMTRGPAGYISVGNNTKGVSGDWAIGPLRATTPDERKGQVGNDASRGTGKIKNG